MLLYFVFVLGIGFALKRFMKTSKDYLQAGRSLPAWICGLAFISANLGAQEVIGMGASGAKYGIVISQFYWIGAIPAMIFVGVFMMPFYYGSKARSVPEFLRLRFDEKTRAWNACTFAFMTVLSSGISMYAMARLIQTLHVFDKPFMHLGLPLQWIFHFSIVLSALIVLCYIFLGGLTSAIYNEVLQFFLIVAGFLPLVWVGLKNVGGWSGLKETLSAAYMHSWRGLSSSHTNPLGVDWFTLVAGLGFVLSFGYWCTDFLVVQRGLAAKDMPAAQRTPLIAAVPKMFFPLMVVLPGLVAIALDPHLTQYLNGRYDNALPAMLGKFYPSGLLGIGLTALMASFMSGMAGNVTAFNTVWTFDIYQTHVNPGQPDGHYLKMGRLATVFAVAVGIGTAFIVLRFNNLMDYLQLLFAFFNAPLFGTFLLGMFWKRTTAHSGFWGLLSGILAAATHYSLYHYHVIMYPSDMAANFYQAIWAFSVCVVVTVVVTMFTEPRKEEELVGLVYSLTPKPRNQDLPWYERPGILAVGILGLCTVLNVIFW
jgi:SSS family solute:Na+ symporter